MLLSNAGRLGLQISQVFRGYTHQAPENVFNINIRQAEITGAYLDC